MAAACVAGLLTACGGSDHPAPGTIAQEAQKNGLTALLAAATKAGLAPTLAASNANLTVFAPTDAAFTTLATQLGFADATAMVTALTDTQLKSILQYHLLASIKSAADLAAGGAEQSTAYNFPTATAATKLKLSTSSGVTLTDAVLADAQVTSANVPASNGIIHVINKVLVPPGVLNVVQMAQANPAAFSTLVSSLGTANLVNTLKDTGPFTVFAPTNVAFTNAATTVAGLTAPQLVSVLKYHVLSGQTLASQITAGLTVPTLNTNTLAGATLATGQTITINTSPLSITDKTTTPAPITNTDVRASNGVIHVISKVLIPS
jgi:transforming growth factor-beta-induced protein